MSEKSPPTIPLKAAELIPHIIGQSSGHRVSKYDIVVHAGI